MDNKIKDTKLENCFIITEGDGRCIPFGLWKNCKDAVPAFIQIIDGIGNTIAFSVDCYKQMLEIGEKYIHAEIHSIIDAAELPIKRYSRYGYGIDDVHIDHECWGGWSGLVYQDQLIDAYNAYINEYEIEFDGLERFKTYQYEYNEHKELHLETFDLMGKYDSKYKDFPCKAYIPCALELMLFTLYEREIDTILKELGKMTSKDVIARLYPADIDERGRKVKKIIEIASLSALIYQGMERSYLAFQCNSIGRDYFDTIGKRHCNCIDGMNFHVPYCHAEKNLQNKDPYFIIPFYTINNQNKIKVTHWTGETPAQFIARTMDF